MKTKKKENGMGDFVPATIASVPYNQAAELGGGQFIFRTFFEPLCPDCTQWKILIDNRIDSTPAGGPLENKRARAGKDGGRWKILSASIARGRAGDWHINEERVFTFHGAQSADVWPGSVFWSDEISFELGSSDRFAVTWTLEVTPGEIIPAAAETQYPCYQMDCIGEFSLCDGFAIAPRLTAQRRQTDGLIGFLGDSITQGFSSSMDSYSFWCARIAEGLGNAYGYWNLGSGWGRAEHVLSSRAWLAKALMCDVLFVSFGVNEILADYPADKIINDIKNLLQKLKEGRQRKIILCTVPPFNFTGEKEFVWHEVNQHIIDMYGSETEVFDIRRALSRPAPFDNYILEELDSGDGHPSDAAASKIAGMFFAAKLHSRFE